MVAVDISSKPVLRRLLPRGLRNKVRSGTLVDWSDIEPFVAHVPTAHLRIPFRKLAKLHPAQLADIVEAASHDEGEEIIEAVGQDLELQADVFEELDPDHQAEFLQSRSDEEAAHLLARMEPDDAADLLMELDQERRLPILERLPAVAQGKLKRLLRYNPETAGGLMNPDVISVPATATAETALQRVRDATTPGGASTVVFVSADGGTLQGVAPLVDLIRADPKATLSAVGSVPTPWSCIPRRTCTRSSGGCPTTTSRSCRSSTRTGGCSARSPSTTCSSCCCPRVGDASTGCPPPSEAVAAGCVVAS